MNSTKIYIAGHNGMVGNAIFKILKKKKNLIITQSRKDLDLVNQTEVKKFLEKEKPDQIYIAAAKVGGIFANSTFPAEFIYENIMIEANIIHNAFISGVKKILFLGSSCIYPKFSSQPIKESKLLTGKLEPTNEAYSIAKIAGIKLCESYNRQYGESHGIDYRSIMPTNLYGAGDNYDLAISHVIPSLIKKFHEAKINKQSKVKIWGTGNPKREFLYVDDLARACVLIMNLNKKKFYKNLNNNCSHINVGSGYELSIKNLAKKIKNITSFSGQIEFDVKKPDGMKRKKLDSTRIFNWGWKPKVDLEKGLKKTYNDFQKKNY
jgi:GDP-L-fucose synthase